MNSGNILVVNHALFFSDLALRIAGVNYLPKYDLVILDEAHTIEDVAGDHFGLKISEGGIKYQLRTLYDPKKGKGLLNTHGKTANDAIADVIDLSARGPRRVSLHAAPINVAAGLRKHLFEKMHSVVLTSATMCTSSPTRTTGFQPVRATPEEKALHIRQGAHLPDWTKHESIY